MRAKAVGLVQRNIPHHITFEDPVVLKREAAQRVCGRIIEVDAVQNRKLGGKRMACIDSERNGVIAGARSVEAGAWKTACRLCLRERDLIVEHSGSKIMPRPSLHAEDLL